MTAAYAANHVFKIDNAAGTLKDLTAHVTRVTGLPGRKDMVDITTFGNSGHKWKPTLENVAFSVEGIYDDTDTSGPNDILGGARADTTPSTLSFEYYPNTTTAGKPKYSGECYIENYEEPTDVNSVALWRADFRVDGVVTIAG